MKTVRANLDENNKLWWCIGAVKDCEDEDSRTVCDKCLSTNEGETIAEVVKRVEALPDFKVPGLLKGIIISLEEQIESLAKVLLQEFGGPSKDEGACEMAIRLLREQKIEVDRLLEEEVIRQNTPEPHGNQING